MYGWDCLLLTFIYPGFDCGSCWDFEPPAAFETCPLKQVMRCGISSASHVPADASGCSPGPGDGDLSKNMRGAEKERTKKTGPYECKRMKLEKFPPSKTAWMWAGETFPTSTGQPNGQAVHKRPPPSCCHASGNGSWKTLAPLGRSLKCLTAIKKSECNQIKGELQGLAAFCAAPGSGKLTNT